MAQPHCFLCIVSHFYNLLIPFIYNRCSEWQIDQWKKVVGSSPGQHLKKFAAENKNSSLLKAANKAKIPVKKTKKVTTKNTDYGPLAECSSLSDMEYSSEYERVLQKLKISCNDHYRIERETFDKTVNGQILYIKCAEGTG